MAEAGAPATGQIAWIDLTVPNAEAMRAFYEHVTGWTASAVSMGDHCMIPAGSDKPVAGVCHALGEIAALPRVWIIYISVVDLDASIRRRLEKGGKVRAAERRVAGMGCYCVIEDPAGAIAALYQAE